MRADLLNLKDFTPDRLFMTRFPLFVFACMILVSAPLQAQEEKLAAQTCTIIADAIIPLKPPTFGGSVEWRRVMGFEGADTVTDMMALADGGVITVGKSISYNRTTGSQPPTFYLNRLDGNGKLEFEKRLPVKGLVDVAAGAILKDRIIGLSHIRDDKSISSARIDFIDGAGGIKSTHFISDPARSIVPNDIIVNPDGATLTLAATRINPKNEDDATTVLYKIGADGKIKSEREYLPGVKTKISQLQRLSDGRIVAAGRIRTDGGQRDAGWLMLVSRQGDLLFQRPYARGGQSQLNRAIDDGSGGLYVAGESIPSDGGYRAAWVMHVAGNGEVLWQRFLNGKYRYGAVDILRQKDGRLQVLMSGRPVADGGREHARIITMTSTGDILQDDAYLEGSNALPVRLIEHSVTKKRLVAGIAQTGFAEYGIPEDQKMATYDAWVTGLPVLPAYMDPCKPAQTETLDD